MIFCLFYFDSFEKSNWLQKPKLKGHDVAHINGIQQLLKTHIFQNKLYRGLSELTPYKIQLGLTQLGAWMPSYACKNISSISGMYFLKFIREDIDRLWGQSSREIYTVYINC